MLYFLIDSLNNLDRVYHYSIAAFVQILKKGALHRLQLQQLEKRSSVHTRLRAFPLLACPICGNL
jgi:hypothetical protein